uniref:Uncharacterized protein n=1 Tax=Anguilla anguilla TaxID=7936 RepID=A0A0E9RLS7_ANGAN
MKASISPRYFRQRVKKSYFYYFIFSVCKLFEALRRSREDSLFDISIIFYVRLLQKNKKKNGISFYQGV